MRVRLDEILVRCAVTGNADNPERFGSECRAAWELLEAGLRRLFKVLARCGCNSPGRGCGCGAQVDDWVQDALRLIIKEVLPRIDEFRDPVAYVHAVCRNMFRDNRDKASAQKRGGVKREDGTRCQGGEFVPFDEEGIYESSNHLNQDQEGFMAKICLAEVFETTEGWS